MIQYLRRTLQPACFHGRKNLTPFFEGWYYKLTDSTGRRTLAVIPGIFRETATDSSHAFIQFVDSADKKTHYIRYRLDEFRFVEGVFDIGIAWNRFTEKQLHLDIHTPELQLAGDLKFTNLTPWPVTLFSPGAMGWYAWVPLMECFHGIISMDHKISGALEYDGKKIDFTGGRGYMEKDWGQVFPQAWFWMQCNHFSQPGTSFSGSLAIIPWIRKPFPGFIMGLWHNGHLYRFTTYNGTRVRKIKWQDSTLELILENRNYRINLLVEQGASFPLMAPGWNGMIRQISESLDTRIQLQLFSISNKKTTLLLEDQSGMAGFEAGGDLENLLGMI